jgi:GTP-binding protein
MTAKPVLNRAQFHTSVAQLRDLPYSRAEIAFAGRSNAGKSSAINLLTPKKPAAFSKTRAEPAHQLSGWMPATCLVDLPGGRESSARSEGKWRTAVALSAGRRRFRWGWC